MPRRPPRPTLFPYTTLFRSQSSRIARSVVAPLERGLERHAGARERQDRKSTRLNSSHEWISYAVFCLKKKNRAILDAHKALDRRSLGTVAQPRANATRHTDR